MSYCRVNFIRSIITFLCFLSLFDIFMQWTPYMDDIEVRHELLQFSLPHSIYLLDKRSAY